MTALGKLTHSGAYRGALAADLSERHNVNGQAVEPVTVFDRHSAALLEHVRALRDTAKEVKAAKEPRGAHAPQDTASPARPLPPPGTALPAMPPAPQPQAGREPRQKRETIHLGGLSSAELERRKAALRAAG